MASQTLYPSRAALPGSENSPVNGSEAPILIGAVLLAAPPELLLSLDPHPAATAASTAATKTTGAILLTIKSSPLLRPANDCSDKTANDCDLGRRLVNGLRAVKRRRPPPRAARSTRGRPARSGARSRAAAPQGRPAARAACPQPRSRACSAGAARW